MPRKKSPEQSEEQKAATTASLEVPKMGKTPQLVKGMKDILPQDQLLWEHIRQLIAKIARDYSFERIDTPVLEFTSLYVHGVGKQTDVVEKEMYTFVDLGGDTLSLRPEFTAGISRAFIEHGMHNLPQPVKLYTVGPLFRHEKPQADRYRQHNQFNCEIFGESKPAVDAQLIMVASKFYRALGIPAVLHLNSLGCLVCRPAFKEALGEYYKGKRNQICEDCKRRLLKNPMRLLDCKQEQCQPIKQEAPQLVDFLCQECSEHFEKVLEFVGEFELSYEFDPRLVRGFDYYTRTVFEFYTATGEGETQGLAIGGGGRYDHLVETLGGRPSPACGFGIGIERVVTILKELQKAGNTIPGFKEPVIDVFVAQLGEQAKRKAMVMYEDLLQEGFSVTEQFTKDSLKAQLEMANKMGVRFTLILGQKELLDGTIIIRNMEGGEQEVVDIKKIVPILQKKLSQEHNQKHNPVTHEVATATSEEGDNE